MSAFFKKISNLTYVLFIIIYSFGRYLLYDEKGLILFGSVDFFIGVVYDVLFCVILLIILNICKKIKVLPYIVIFIVVALHLANIEYIYAMNNVINLKDISFLKDKQFLLGSAFQITFPIYSICFTLISLFVAISFNYNKIKTKKNIALFCILSSIVLFIAVLSGDNIWSKRNFVTTSIGNSVRVSIAKSSNINDIPYDLIEKITKNGQVGEGEPLIEFASSKKKNIIMVIMEGIPGSYLLESQNRLNIHNNMTLMSLEEIKDNSILVPNFITHNNQTIRGLYSILSGDYPKLDSSTPKAYEFVQDKNQQHMIPSELKKSGYNTAYLQAAPLEFMSKDRFMKEAGFDTVIGSDGFSNSYIPFEWGADDKTFFEQSLGYIDTLDKKAQPWFVTMLTVGTHHPYAAPKELEDQLGNKKDASIKYLDLALKDFINSVKNSNYAEDTLILFISDESHGVNDQPYGSNWGICLAFSPDIKEMVINDGVFGHKDLYNSIMDYIDPVDNASIPGRSIFREYNKENPILFASHYSGDLYYSKEKGKVFQLNRNNELFSIESDNGEMFSSSYSKIKVYDDKMRDEIQNYRDYVNNSSKSSELRIIDQENFHINHGENKAITDGQYLSLPANKYISIGFEYELINPNKGDYITFLLKDSGNPNLTNYRIVDYSDNLGRIEYNFYNDNETTGYNFALGLKASTESDHLDVKIKNLSISFEDFFDNKDKTDLSFESYLSDSLYLSKNLVPFLSTQSGAYLTKENSVFIESTVVGSYLVFGPYLEYPRGKYNLMVKLKNNGRNENLFKLDVATNSGRNILAEKEFLMQSSDEEMLAELPFEIIDDSSNVELRLMGLSELDIEVINVSTKKNEKL
ncbi:LTA synthase family protein [Paenibacillus lautus]|uniref:LTA synthase family protein n=1 Tax=Paenibacillus lautus TaxID=1401 RepID=UPI003D2E297C